jgi:2,3-diaminopropionate biosynthesis protein SbnA
VIVENAYEIVTDEIFLHLPDMLRAQPGAPPDVEVYLKLEGLNPAGSVKLKTAVALIEDAERSGSLTPGARVVESSSGNLGIALSIVCSLRGYRFTCITDPNASARSIPTMRALGAEVLVVEERDANGGYLGSRIALIRRMLDADPSLVWTNQYANVANPKAHSERTAASILREFGVVDYLFVGAGTTGTLMGCASYFRTFSPMTHVIAVDSVGSVTFGAPAGPRHIPGLGTSRRPELCDPAHLHDVVFVTESDAVRACRKISAEYGLLVGGSTGSVLAAVESYCPRMTPGARVVAISPDLGDRYLDTVYDDGWVTSRLGPHTLTDDLFIPSPRTVRS